MIIYLSDSRGGVDVEAAIVGPILALLGVLAGAMITHNRETAKARQDRVSQAYKSFIDAIAFSSNPEYNRVHLKNLRGEQCTPDEAKVLTEGYERWMTAHSSVLIYGSERVIRAISKHYRAQLTGDQMRVSFSIGQFIEAMRQDTARRSFRDFADYAEEFMGKGQTERGSAWAQHMEAQAKMTANVPS